MSTTRSSRRTGYHVAAAGALAAATAACGFTWALWWQAWPAYVLYLVLVGVFAVRWMPVWVVSLVMPPAFAAAMAVPFLTADVTTGLWVIGVGGAFVTMAVATPLVAVIADAAWRHRARNS